MAERGADDAFDELPDINEADDVLQHLSGEGIEMALQTIADQQQPILDPSTPSAV